MKLYVVRHGESIGNVTNILQGQLNFDLTDVGYMQAQKIAQRLKNHSFDAIYSSDLRRALYTAQHINQHHNKEIIIDPQLRELTHGIDEGRSKSRVEEEFLEQYQTDSNFKFEQGESFNELITRITPVYEALLENHKGQEVLVVCHGMVTKAFVALVQNKGEISPQEFHDFKTTWRTSNTCLYEFDITNKDEPKILTTNCTLHLK